MSGKRWSSDRRSDQSEGEAGSRDEYQTTCSAVDVGAMKMQDLFLARLSESVGRHAAMPVGLRGSFKSQPRQA